MKNPAFKTVPNWIDINGLIFAILVISGRFLGDAVCGDSQNRWFIIHILIVRSTLQNCNSCLLTSFSLNLPLRLSLLAGRECRLARNAH